METHLRAAAVLSASSVSLGADDEYHGLRSCLVGASAMPRSVSVSAGLDLEARAARAAACSSRSANRLMCPSDMGIEDDPDPDAMGCAGPSASLSLGGGECGGELIPARERSTSIRDSASCKGIVNTGLARRRRTYGYENTICILCLLEFGSCFIATDTLDVVESIRMI